MFIANQSEPESFRSVRSETWNSSRPEVSRSYGALVPWACQAINISPLWGEVPVCLLPFKGVKSDCTDRSPTNRNFLFF